MESEDVRKILEYLKKQGQTNTFRLTRELGINRHRLLKVIRELEEKEAVGFKSGKVRFLRFPVEKKKVEEKIIEAKKIPPKPTKKKKVKRAIAERESKILEGFQNENKELKERASKLEASLKKQSSIKNKLKKQAKQQIEQLEERIKELQQKAKVPPKIIRKTIVKEVPVKVKEKVKEKKEVKPRKFRIPKFNIAWIKAIQQLKRPKFIERKIPRIPRKLKINFAELNKNIQQLHVPEILRKL